MVPVIGSAACTSYKRGPEDTVHDFLEAWEAMDSRAMVSFLVEDQNVWHVGEYDLSISHNVTAALIRNVHIGVGQTGGQDASIHDIKTGVVDESTSEATVIASWTLESLMEGRADLFRSEWRIEMITEDNRWLISSIKPSYIDSSATVAARPIHREGDWTSFSQFSWIYDLAIEGNRLWIAEETAVVRFDMVDETYTRYTSDDGLVEGYVDAVAIGLDGSKWIGTNKGVSRFDDKSWITYTTDDGLVSDDVSDIEVDSEGHIWFATDRGVSKFDGTTWTGSPELGRSWICRMAIGGEGTAWFSQYNRGVARFDGTTWAFYTPDDGLIDSEVEAILVNEDGNVWFGTQYGASMFDGKTWTNHWADPTVLPLYDTLDIVVDSEGNLWFGTSVGLVFKFDGTTWNASYLDQELYNDAVWAIVIDDEGNKWFGAESGLYRLSG
ncbi:MAG: hypothetical protein JSW38_07165 [Dehalococcoidia bacterium]|nr:MAG: hypothetical protein JSW38_07165 [Dehalococcoidia bacterium]